MDGGLTPYNKIIPQFRKKINIFTIKIIVVNLPLLYLLHEINISVLKKIPTKHIKVYSLYLYIINMADILLLDLRLITTL